jgi:hypothetical protein
MEIPGIKRVHTMIIGYFNMIFSLDFDRVVHYNWFVRVIEHCEV